MQEEFHIPVNFLGYVQMIIAVGTIFSSLISARFTQKFGTRIITLVGVLFTAIALCGFSFGSSY